MLSVKNHSIKNRLMLCSMVALSSTAISCASRGDHHDLPGPAADPNQRVAEIHANSAKALPDSGAYYKDLLGTYCKVTLNVQASGPNGDSAAAADTSLLLSDLSGPKQDDWATVLLPDKEGRAIANSTSVQVSNIKTTSCSLDKAVGEQKTTVLLASVSLYANDERSSGPICKLLPGAISGGALQVSATSGKHSWQVEIPESMKVSCGGATWGYSELQPPYEMLLKQL